MGDRGGGREGEGGRKGGREGEESRDKKKEEEMLKCHDLQLNHQRLHTV